MCGNNYTALLLTGNLCIQRRWPREPGPGTECWGPIFGACAAIKPKRMYKKKQYHNLPNAPKDLRTKIA